jgi:hypothetical protein
MRFTKMILGLSTAGAMAMAFTVGCGSSTTQGGGGNTSTGSGGNTGTTSACTQPTDCSLNNCKCAAADFECAGLVDNKGQTKFGLRMSQLDITAPGALSSGLVAGIVATAVGPSDANCYLDGKGTFSWLLQFDTAAKTLKTGGAKPVDDATAGYSFIDETISAVHVAPITFDNVTVGTDGAFATATGLDLYVPIYIDATTVVILPLKAAKFSSGYLSSTQSCIGKFNAAGLDPAGGCLPDSQNPSFITSGANTGAKLDGMITLEDADKVMVTSAKQSLCYLLAGSDPQYGVSDGSNPPNMLCKRDSAGKIIFAGDSCASGAGCTDAMKLSATFAAASVKINN